MPEPALPSRTAPQTLVPAARALYEQGHTCDEVLRAIYGVALPREASLFLRDFVDGGKPLSADWRLLPWELMRPLDRGGPRHQLPSDAAASEARLYARSPDILLLGKTGHGAVRHGGSLIAYDLAELRAGRSTVVGLEQVPRLPRSGAQFTVFGPSLLAVFHELVTTAHAQMERWVTRHVGSYTFAEVDDIAAELEALDALQRELELPR